MTCIIIKNIIGDYAITGEDGQKIYGMIHDRIKQQEETTLDFTGVKIAAPFINAAIGRLYKDIHSDIVDKYLIISPENKTIDHIMSNAKRYHTDAEYRYSVDKVIAEYMSDNI
jgi:hypothetical protein